MARRLQYPAGLEPSQVTEVAQTLTMPFAGSTIRGNPALPLDRSKLTALVWQLSVPLAGNADGGDTACMAELEVSDVTSYR